MKAVLLLLTLACSLGFAQSADAPKEMALRYYKLDFVVKDIDEGKVITARNYSIIVRNDNRNGDDQIRAGSKIPIGGDPPQYVDIGTNIDVGHVIDSSGELSFHLSAEVSNVLSDGSSPRPIIRQNRWSSYVTVPIKKPTIVFSSDDNTTKHIMQLEVTATPRT
jgi:hypothetical protein